MQSQLIKLEEVGVKEEIVIKDMNGTKYQLSVYVTQKNQMFQYYLFSNVYMINNTGLELFFYKSI
jgi:hypothetical protein